MVVRDPLREVDRTGVQALRGAWREEGFTLVELLVAMVVIVIGALGTMMMIDRANAGSSESKVSQIATGLSRSLLETAQGLPYTSVNSSTLVSTLQANGFPDDVPGTPAWEVIRDGITFRVDATECTVDDPSDGLGSHSAGGFCADSPSGSGDSNPDDYKRVTITVTPPPGTAPAMTGTTIVGSTRVSNPSGGGGGAGGGGVRVNVSSMQITAPTLYYGQVAPCANSSQCTTYDVTTSAVQPKTVTFQAVTAASAQEVKFAVDGQVYATVNGPGTTFTWTWALPNDQPDGAYTVTAQTFDSSGTTALSDPKPVSVTLNRYRPDPGAYDGTAAGRNPLFAGVPEIETYPQPGTARVDRDVTGFQILRYAGGAPGVVACSTSSVAVRWCADTTAPGSGSTLKYGIFPMDKNPDGSARAGTTGVSQSGDVNAANSAPSAPTGLTVTRGGMVVELNWTNPAGSGDPDSGDCVSFFRVYSKPAGDGSAWTYADRISRTPFGNAVQPCGSGSDEQSNSITLWENDSNPKQYRVTAVDTHEAESTMASAAG